jgi:predicted DsbA family dithiol-disulfide isomerase
VTEPIRLDVFSDYLCPWCYNAAVRLADVRREYGDRLRVHWRTFPLIPDQQPGRRATQKTRDGRQRVGAEEPGAVFMPPPLDLELPSSSVPALTAAKCAERQGDALFERFHGALFLAHFRDNLDVSRWDVLCRVAGETGLEMDRFRHDYADGAAYEEVLRDCAEGAAWFGVSALPTAIFNEKLSLVGAVPTQRYREMIDWILAGEPGGVIPLPREASIAAAPGQSAVARRAVS